MAQIKGLLFDFNGTLFFDTPFHIEAFRRCFIKYGARDLSVQEIVNNILGKSNDQIFKYAVDKNATHEDIVAFEKLKEGLYMEICKENKEDFHLCDGACEMFDFLKQHGIPYCIATGSPYENVKFYFEYLGLEKWFTLDNIVYITGEFPGKPAPDIYIHAAARLGLVPEQCAVFEDATSGIIAARKAGARKVFAVFHSDLPSPVTDNAHADGVYHDLSCYKDILHGLDMI